MGNGPNIQDILGAIARGDGKIRVHHLGSADAIDDSRDYKNSVSIDKDAQIMELAAAASRYVAGCEFKPLDIVTPRDGFATSGVGLPHVVLEVVDDPVAKWRADLDPSSTSQGGRYDMRVLCFVRNDVMAPFWVESYQYEKYE